MNDSDFIKDAPYYKVLAVPVKQYSVIESGPELVVNIYCII